MTNRPLTKGNGIIYNATVLGKPRPAALPTERRQLRNATVLLTRLSMGVAGAARSVYIT